MRKESRGTNVESINGLSGSPVQYGGRNIHISREMKTPGMLDIELLKCVWESIFSSTLTHIILNFFVFV